MSELELWFPLCLSMRICQKEDLSSELQRVRQGGNSLPNGACFTSEELCSLGSCFKVYY